MRPPPPRRAPLRVDPGALPDPAAWREPRSPYGGAIRRVLLFGGGAVLLLAASGVALRAITRRAASVSAASAPAELLGRLPGLAAEGEREKPAPRVLSGEEIADLQRSWIGSETIAPREAVVDAATGERVRPFQGFAVEVETAPAGARIEVNGVAVGDSPILATIRCEPGERLSVRATAGRTEGRASTRCRKDAVVTMRLALTARP